MMVNDRQLIPSRGVGLGFQQPTDETRYDDEGVFVLVADEMDGLTIVMIEPLQFTPDSILSADVLADTYRAHNLTLLVPQEGERQENLTEFP